jgi:hypothetical protein
VSPQREILTHVHTIIKAAPTALNHVISDMDNFMSKPILNFQGEAPEKPQNTDSNFYEMSERSCRIVQERNSKLE